MSLVRYIYIQYKSSDLCRNIDTNTWLPVPYKSYRCQLNEYAYKCFNFKNYLTARRGQLVAWIGSFTVYNFRRLCQ